MVSFGGDEFVLFLMNKSKFNYNLYISSIPLISSKNGLGIVEITK